MKFKKAHLIFPGIALVLAVVWALDLFPSFGWVNLLVASGILFIVEQFIEVDDEINK